MAKTLVTNQAETSRRFYTKPHPYYWGIALHTRTRYVCLLDHAGETLVPRHRQATPKALLKAIAPDRDQLVIAADWMLTWYGLADLCAEHSRPVVRGQALDLQAIHGGTANKDQIDAQTIAVLLRGGLLPPASVYPREMRAPRDRLRRRPHLARTRGDRLAHGQHPNSQDHLPALGKNIASPAHRDGVAERFTAPAGHTSLAVNLALIGGDAALRRDLELASVSAAKHPDAKTL